MSAIWLACCDAVDYQQMLREVEARNAHAQLLRFGSVGDLSRLALEFPEGTAGAAVHARGVEPEKLVREIGELARGGRAPRIVVFVDRFESGYAARLFQAGATEVIAADGACAYDAEAEELAEGKSGASRPESAPSRDTWMPDDLSGLEGTSVDAADRYAARTSRQIPEVKVGGGTSKEPMAADEPGMDASSFRGEGGHDDAPPWDVPAHRAPVVAAVSGRGGVGKTTLVALMACCAARMGLRAAVLDLDLMFGNMHEVLGISEPSDLAVIARDSEGLADADIEASAMRVGPGLTLWGPVAVPEQAELLGLPCERLISALRGLADVIFVDTSVFWGDAAAAAVSACDRCLIVGGAGPSACSSAVRATNLAARLGVPRTKMTAVLNRYGARDCGEEFALRFELAVSLRSKARIADGGSDVESMLAFGKASELVSGKSALAKDIQAFSAGMLRELGCPVGPPEGVQAGGAGGERTRIRLPWKQGAGEQR